MWSKMLKAEASWAVRVRGGHVRKPEGKLIEKKKIINAYIKF